MRVADGLHERSYATSEHGEAGNCRELMQYTADVFPPKAKRENSAGHFEREGSKWVLWGRLRGTDCYEPTAPSKAALIYPLMRVADGLH